MALELRSWRETAKSASITTVLMGAAFVGLDVAMDDKTLYQAMTNWDNYFMPGFILGVELLETAYYRQGQRNGYKQGRADGKGTPNV